MSAPLPGSWSAPLPESLVQTSTKGGRNVALLIAYAYFNTRSFLKGTIPDIVRVFKHLTQDRGFLAEVITILTDSPDLRPYPGAKIIRANTYSGSPNQFLEALQTTIA